MNIGSDPENVYEEIDKEKVAEKAKGLVSGLKKGKELHDQFGKSFEERYLISGKKMADWKAQFKLSIPNDLGPQQVREYASNVMDLYQEATFYRMSCEARIQSLKNTNDAAYRKEFTRLVNQYKEAGQKLPSKDTLAALTNDTIGDIQDAIAHADIELAFWKGILSNLDVSRKIIDTISISLATEAKALQSEKFIDNMASKHYSNGNPF